MDENQQNQVATVVQKSTDVATQSQQPDDVTAIMQVIERCATNPDVDVNKMEKLWEMQERIMARKGKAAFDASFAQMQAGLPVIDEKGRIVVNGQTRSTYGKFEDINEAVKPILKAHGFGVRFRIEQGDKIKVFCVLSHELGHSEETDVELPADTSGSKNAAQAVVSSVSYGKRTTMCAILNITTRGEDDDGQNAADPVVTEPQAKIIATLVGQCMPHQKEAFAAAHGTPEAVKRKDADRVIANLKKCVEANNARNN